MSEAAKVDEYEEYNYEQDKFMHAGSGKQRSKKEASEHTNHHNPGGHERKLVTKMTNTEHNHNKDAKSQPKPKTGSSPPQS